MLDEVARYWAKAPTSNFAYDIDDTDSIPSAWEMISTGEWCRNSIAIGMEFTLRLAGWPTDQLILALIRDFDISEMNLVLIIDESKLLNYTYGEVSEYPNTHHDILGRWRFNGRVYTPVV